MSPRAGVVLALIGLFTIATEQSAFACSCPAAGPACLPPQPAPDSIEAARIRGITRARIARDIVTQPA